MTPSPSASSLHRLSCMPRSVVFHVCLRDEDILALGLDSQSAPLGLDKSAWLRHELLLHTSREPSLLSWLTDLLDLRYADSIWRVRSTCVGQLSQKVMLRIGRHPDEEFAGLLWALLSDERSDVRCLGIFWCQTWLGQVLESVGRPQA
ncbi:MAG: hypothetical protein CSA62_10155 [Planctomycetota bacterium]|nr:MAG: hypothetical protein CSA62_10155 [Planctomycetota bacterium]